MSDRDFEKAALCGEPSYVWRAGQQRRLDMILQAAGDRLTGSLLENGCGVGMYVEHLKPHVRLVIGLEYEPERARQAHLSSDHILAAAGEHLPFEDNTFDLVLSHEVLEHVQDDRQAVEQMVRVLRPGGRAIIFVPNRGYPFETHGVYWREVYHFGNIPLVNYLPPRLRDRLAPHVRVYSSRDLSDLFYGLPVRTVKKAIIFGAYDNLIVRYPRVGNLVRRILQGLERTPLSVFGLSHFWVLEKI
jgi:SAM-dependent methyltransferase